MTKIFHVSTINIIVIERIVIEQVRLPHSRKPTKPKMLLTKVPDLDVRVWTAFLKMKVPSVRFWALYTSSRS